MDVQLSIDEQEIWEQRRRRLEALMGSDPSQRQHDPAQSDKIMDPQLFSAAKEEDVDKFIEDLEDHCAKERVSLPVLLGLCSPSKNTLFHAATESDNNVKAVINFVPEDYAMYRNYFPGVKFLIEKLPASALEPDSKDGYLPIHVACTMNRVTVVKELLRQWPDAAEFLTRRGQNILHVSARYARIATVEYILKDPKFGHLINTRDLDGNTPLHLAALHYQPSVVLLARHKSVDHKPVNMNNMTALDVVDQEDIKTFGSLIQKGLMRRILSSARTPRSRELAICKPTGQRPQKLPEPLGSGTSEDAVNTRVVVAALMASVTFTSGFSVPEGYNGSDPNAGILYCRRIYQHLFALLINLDVILMYLLFNISKLTG